MKSFYSGRSQDWKTLYGLLKGNLFYLLPVLKFCYCCWPAWQDNNRMAKLNGGPQRAGLVYGFIYCLHIRIQTVCKGSGTICVDGWEQPDREQLDEILRQDCYALLQCILSANKSFFWNLWTAPWSRELQGEGFVKEMLESCLSICVCVCICMYIHVCV